MLSMLTYDSATGLHTFYAVYGSVPYTFGSTLMHQPCCAGNGVNGPKAWARSSCSVRQLLAIQLQHGSWLSDLLQRYGVPPMCVHKSHPVKIAHRARYICTSHPGPKT